MDARVSDPVENCLDLDLWISIFSKPGSGSLTGSLHISKNMKFTLFWGEIVKNMKFYKQLVRSYTHSDQTNVKLQIKTCKIVKNAENQVFSS